MSLPAGEECSDWPVSFANIRDFNFSLKLFEWLCVAVWDIVSNFQPGDIFIGHFTASYTSSDWT